MSPSRIKPFVWSGWYLTSWLRNEAASSGRWSSASSNAKLNSALRKSCFKWTARRNQFSASSMFLSSIASMPMLKWTRSFLSAFRFCFKTERMQKVYSHSQVHTICETRTKLRKISKWKLNININVWDWAIFFFCLLISGCYSLFFFSFICCSLNYAHNYMAYV